MQQSASEFGCKEVLWCSSTDWEGSDSDTESEDDGDMKKAYVSRRYVWKNRKELLVRFHNQVPPEWLYKGEPVDGNLIMTWANVWNDMCIQYFGDNQESMGAIPKFVEASSAVARDTLDYDILLHFNSVGKNLSEIGMSAQNKRINEPTMYLDLSNGDDVYKKYLVIHEFGHALGLLHEHQRSDFWKHINPHIDVTKMKETVTHTFKRDWGKDKSHNAAVSDYDPDSIMHYWFDKDWLQGYTSEDQIDKDLKAGKLTKGEACVLLGVFKRDKNVASEPSKLDIEFLMKEYGVWHYSRDSIDEGHRCCCVVS